MATKNATTQRGNYICKVGYMDIYQKTEKSIIGRGRDRKINSNTSVGIYHAKYQMIGDAYNMYYEHFGVEDPRELKNIELAKKIAAEMVQMREMKPSIKRKNK